MKHTVVKYSLLSMLMLLLVACEVKYPKNIIQPDKMEALLYDYHLVQVMSTDVSGSEYKRKLYAEYVFDKHGVTKELFDSSMVWYTRNPKHLYDIYVSLEKTLLAEVGQKEEVKNTTAVALSSTVEMNGDIVNLWQGPSLTLLSATPIMNRISFSYDADSTYYAGDSVVMEMNVLFIPSKDEELKQFAHTAMMVEYEDGLYNSVGCMINTSGRHTLSVPRNYDSMIKSIRGYVYYTDNSSSARARMIIDKFAVTRLHPDDNDSE